MIGKQTLGVSDKDSWKMFRGSAMRTGISASRISRKPSLLWVTEVGPTVSSPIFADDTIYVSTITGRIFALNLSEKKIKWHLYVGSPIVSSPLIYNGILVAATYDSWIKDTSLTGKNFLLGMDSNYGTQIWNYEIDDCRISGRFALYLWFRKPSILHTMTQIYGCTNFRKFET